MGRFTAFAFALSVMVLFTAPALALPLERDLGEIPTNGVEAARTLLERERSVIRELACGDEAGFAAQLKNGPGNRPISHVMAKAAALAGTLAADNGCSITQVVNPRDWAKDVGAYATLPVTWDTIAAKADALNGELNDPAHPRPEADVQADATRLAVEMADTASQTIKDGVGRGSDDCVGLPITAVAKLRSGPPRFEYQITISLTAACLARQIAVVINARDFVRTGNPGTSHLPCAKMLSDVPSGDWDMGVSRLTRVAFLLRQVQRRRGITEPLATVMDKLQGRLLTLSGGPAKEVYNLLTTCGNPDNSYGSARDRLDDNTFYDPDLGKTVQGSGQGDDSSFWEDLFGILMWLVAAALLAAGAWGLGTLVSMGLGSLIGAAVAAGVIAILLLLGIPQQLIGLAFGGIEETENHLFMQNVSKYLKNKMLIEELYALHDDDGVEDYEDSNQELREWLLKRLQRVVREDFAEYNAKPYSGLSITAITNLHDFVCEAGYRTIDRTLGWPRYCAPADKRLVDAAASVLDLTAAKAALSTNQGRRFIPFRRLADTNAVYVLGALGLDGSRGPLRPILELGGGSDHMLAATQLWTGMTFHGPGGHASTQSLGSMVWHATSIYRPHAMILDLAIDKTTPYEQSYHHAGWERYSSGPAWLLTAGGTGTGPAQGFRWPLGVQTGGIAGFFIKDADYGAGVPTTLIVASAQRYKATQTSPDVDFLPAVRSRGDRLDTLNDFIRFEGAVRDEDSFEEDGYIHEPKFYEDNFCVHGSFACGINLKMPALPSTCITSSDDGTGSAARRFSVIDSSTCWLWNNGDASDDFYVIVYKQPCSADGCAGSSEWGFIEIVEKRAWPDRAALIQRVLSDNKENFDDMGGTGGDEEVTYKSVANGLVKFEPDCSCITEIDRDDADENEPDWPRASGIVEFVDDEHFTITHPRTRQKIDIDFTDWVNPHRVLPP